MPTFEGLPRFWRDFEALASPQQTEVKRARDQFVAVLRRFEEAGCRERPTFPAHLGVRSMQGAHRGILEFAWANNGRCTWEYGTPQEFGKYHVVWRRCGSHDIYTDP